MLDSPLVSDLIRLAIEEDLLLGDITTELTIPDTFSSKAEYIAKEKCVVCGTPLLQRIFAEMGCNFNLDLLTADGEEVKAGQVIAVISGKTKQILSCERLTLNFLQHLSGIATQVRKISSKISNLKILDTRKTTPGLRVLQKYAVKIGGGSNHRMNLGDMILVKNNHIDAHGNLRLLIKDLLQKKPPYMPFEIEVRNMDELKIVLEFKPDIIMLDNMTDTQIKNAVAMIKKVSSKIMIEVSGRVDGGRLQKLESLGADYASMGMLTNKVHSVDISLRIIEQNKSI